jgi:hypothetical protein
LGAYLWEAPLYCGKQISGRIRPVQVQLESHGVIRKLGGAACRGSDT